MIQHRPLRVALTRPPVYVDINYNSGVRGQAVAKALLQAQKWRESI